MSIKLTDRIKSFAELGDRIQKVLKSSNTSDLSISETALFDAIKKASLHNPWYTEENCRHAMSGLAIILEKQKIEYWLNSYNINEKNSNPKTIAVVMAGNIPAVGFHDFLCVLISGNKILAKLSSQDDVLIKAISEVLEDINNEWKTYIKFEDNIIRGFDAVIATGSNNTARYFEYYFGKYPNIIRKNRNSIAVLSGKENDTEIEGLGEDIFRYFGLGCRNVSQILIPESYRIEDLLPSFETWSFIGNHHKWANNYDYNKSIFLVNQVDHLDNGFAIFKPDQKLHSPVSVLNFHKYKTIEDVKALINSEANSIQCISSNIEIGIDNVSIVPLGKTQMPELWDYADRIDTMDLVLSC
ncbi:MAG: acyl-CoA reductase [Bacteroidetes bacterium]|nr:acyl-CoA reductase [Bacteroidota bacterium]